MSIQYGILFTFKDNNKNNILNDYFLKNYYQKINDTFYLKEMKEGDDTLINIILDIQYLIKNYYDEMKKIQDFKLMRLTDFSDLKKLIS